MAVRRWLLVLTPLVLTVSAVLYYVERDICLLLVFFVLGCCGCCSDFGADEIRFRQWQLLREKEEAQHSEFEQWRGKGRASPSKAPAEHYQA